MAANKKSKTSAANVTSNPGSARKGDDNGKQIAAIGDEDTIIGFGLTGVKYLTTVSSDSDDKEILTSISEYIETPGIGFVIITQSLAERIRTDFERLKLDKPLYPIFIELPDKTGELADRIDPIKTLIRRAIGMEIVKNE